MHTRHMTLLVSLALTIPVCGAEPAGEMPQQTQLNRASQQSLERIQSDAGADAQADKPWREKSLDRRQRSEQLGLQESQRREVLMQNQRARSVNTPGSKRRLDAIGRQGQHRIQQQNQLNRFRIQRGTGTR